MNDMSLRDTIAPKSDQLNADDLMVGPITVTVTNVSRGSSDQPVSIAITGGYQPYKPCKSMRRVLIALWGDNGHEWVGRSMRLYCDPEVKFGGVKVGGIRISHMSHIQGRQALMLTITRSRRAEFVVEPLEDDAAKYEADTLPLLREASLEGTDALQKAFKALPANPLKAKLWEAQGESLKSAAAEADNAIEQDEQFEREVPNE